MAYDLIVIGSGPGGYLCAVKAAQLKLGLPADSYPTLELTERLRALH